LFLLQLCVLLQSCLVNYVEWNVSQAGSKQRPLSRSQNDLHSCLDSWLISRFFVSLISLERFLDADGGIKHSKNYLPFSIGRRQCLGKTQGETICYLLYSWLFQRYTFTKVPQPEQQSLLVQNPEIQAARSPKTFKVIVHKRY
jgi:hypothetical protein